jgi:hypothetical protein
MQESQPLTFVGGAGISREAGKSGSEKSLYRCKRTWMLEQSSEFFLPQQSSTVIEAPIDRLVQQFNRIRHVPSSCLQPRESVEGPTRDDRVLQCALVSSNRLLNLGEPFVAVSQL